MTTRKRTTAGALSWSMIACASALFQCGDDGLPDHAWIRGRVTDVEGAPLADMEVRAGELSARTDLRGRFQLEARTGSELRLSVNSDAHSSAELPVTTTSGGAHVEIAVKPRRTLTMLNAAAGGRVEGDDGFALELPADALRDASGAPVIGEVEVRYVLINQPREITAAPGRMQALDGGGLEGLGMAEVSFYQAGRRVKLAKEMQVEVPLHEGHGLSEGREVDLYRLTEQDARWIPSTRGQVQGSKVRLTTAQDAWVGAAQALPAASCVKGKLELGAERGVANATVRAARARGLSLVQVETQADGSFCMPVTAADDWRVSTFFDDGDAAFGVQVDLRSDEASGICGGTGCKDVGRVALSRLE